MKSKAAIGTHPLHPMLVSFPIGLFGGSLVCDLIGTVSGSKKLQDTGYRMMLGGLVSALGAAVPGIIDYLTVVPPRSHAGDTAKKHALANTAVSALYSANLVLRAKDGPMPISLVLSAAACGLLVYSGWLGGSLVYDDQIGVSHLNVAELEHLQFPTCDAIAGDFVSVCSRDDLKKGQLGLVVINGQRLVLTHTEDDHFVAFADSCTHLGGPLSDGTLLGNRVMCPWHGSCFDVTNGGVVCGPATEPIRTYEVQVEGDRVQVRAPVEAERPLLEPGSLA